MTMLVRRSSTSLKASTTRDAVTHRSAIAHPCSSRNVRRSSPDLTLTCPRNRGKPTDFTRLNRRMHNKSFTADDQVSIVGGRNVGDEYFGASGAVLFADLDVIAVGPVIRDVSSQFERYWNSESVYPLDRLVPKIQRD